MYNLIIKLFPMSDCCSAPGLMPFKTALKQLLDNVPTATKTQMIAIENCLDRVLATDIVSPVNVPPHDNSAMDGYAFHSNIIEHLKSTGMNVVGRSFAGEPFSGKTDVGQCIRIMTGAKLPICCDTVVMQENTSLDDRVMTLTKVPKAKANVRYSGEDIAIDDLVFTKGHKLSAIDLGLLASLGIADIEVYAPVTVAVLSTGDELKNPGQVLNEGDIFESNRFALLGLLTRLNVNILDLGIISDDKQAIRDAFIKADIEADVVISSGGVSVGEADYTKEILDELGTINFWKIAMKPGKPFAFGKLPNSVFFGLPGNPVSALVTFYQLSVPGIEKMQGQPYKAKTQFSAVSTTALRKSAGRMDFQRALLSYNDEGLPEVTSTGSQGSGVLSSIGRANCFIVLSADQGSVAADERVIVEPFTAVFQ